ncbi:hypothetical protein sos41_42880 [Alphaproteobacteria bacterium SO-S41]|nr:hypothetical protein sos41_42880 [Alphaproteobacteria bacterium SO-S41]
MIGKTVRFNLIVTALFLALTAGLFWAKTRGWVDSELPTRVAMALTGLFVAFNGNLAPKLGRPGSARRQAVQRVNGWAFFLSGLGSAFVWAVLPLKIAAFASMGIIGLAFVVVLNYCVWTRPQAV